MTNLAAYQIFISLVNNSILENMKNTEVHTDLPNFNNDFVSSILHTLE